MRRGILPLLLLCLGAAQVASAEPVTLTSGGLSFGGALESDYGLGDFLLIGTGFSAFGPQGYASAPGGFLTGFPIGTVDLSGTYSVTPAAFSSPTGRVTVDGQELHGFAAASVQVTAVPLVVTPPAVGTCAGCLSTFRTPFSATGFVWLFANVGDTTPIFTQTVSGTGTLTITGIPGGGDRFVTGGVGMVFPPFGPSPTPEPASVLLLGSGLVAAWKSRRLRQVR